MCPQLSNSQMLTQQGQLGSMPTTERWAHCGPETLISALGTAQVGSLLPPHHKTWGSSRVLGGGASHPGICGASQSSQTCLPEVSPVGVMDQPP
jgi:hypothetical protein